MLDSDVLLDAIHGINGDARPESRAAVALLRQYDRFTVSSITLFEVYHSTDAAQLECLRNLRLDERPIIRPISELAASIALRARKPTQWCDKCWGMIPAATCKKCNAQSSKQQKTNDMLIIATAEYNRVSLLFSRDGGMHNLGAFVTTTKVMCPPPAVEQLELPSNTVLLTKRKR
ncbi:MAG: PIN domain-containing protein [Deltaproteobacteria bacterium]|nr:PIN domain-containing protein [Deltaproteobacteria bacterium]